MIVVPIATPVLHEGRTRCLAPCHVRQPEESGGQFPHGREGGCELRTSVVTGLTRPSRLWKPGLPRCLSKVLAPFLRIERGLLDEEATDKSLRGLKRRK